MSSTRSRPKITEVTTGTPLPLFGDDNNFIDDDGAAATTATLATTTTSTAATTPAAATSATATPITTTTTTTKSHVGVDDDGEDDIDEDEDDNFDDDESVDVKKKDDDDVPPPPTVSLPAKKAPKAADPKPAPVTAPIKARNPVVEIMPELPRISDRKKRKEAILSVEQDVDHYIHLLEFYSLEASLKSTNEASLRELYNSCRVLEQKFNAHIESKADEVKKATIKIALTFAKQIMQRIKEDVANPDEKKIPFFSHESVIARPIINPETGTMETLDDAIEREIVNLTGEKSGIKKTKLYMSAQVPIARMKRTDGFFDGNSARVNYTEIGKDDFTDKSVITVQRYNEKEKLLTSEVRMRTGLGSRINKESALLLAIKTVEDYIASADDPTQRLQLSGDAGKNKDVVRFIMTYIDFMNKHAPMSYPSGCDNHTGKPLGTKFKLFGKNSVRNEINDDDRREFDILLHDINKNTDPKKLPFGESVGLALKKNPVIALQALAKANGGVEPPRLHRSV